MNTKEREPENQRHSCSCCCLDCVQASSNTSTIVSDYHCLATKPAIADKKMQFVLQRDRVRIDQQLALSFTKQIVLTECLPLLTYGLCCVKPTQHTDPTQSTWAKTCCKRGNTKNQGHCPYLSLFAYILGYGYHNPQILMVCIFRASDQLNNKYAVG